MIGRARKSKSVYATLTTPSLGMFVIHRLVPAVVNLYTGTKFEDWIYTLKEDT